MRGKKANRIADLEARLEVALRDRPETPDPGWVQRRSAADAARIRELEWQLRVVAGAYRHQTTRLHRALRACARYRQDTAHQAAVADRLSDQLLDAIDYPPELRARLNHPADTLTGEVRP